MASMMETEFRQMVGVAQKAKETRHDYLERVYDKVVALSDDDWEKLTPKAQKWFNDAGKVEKGQDLPDFPDVESDSTDEDAEEEEKESESESEDTTMAAPKKKKVAKAVKAKAAKPAKKVVAKKKVAAAANGNGSAKREKGALRDSGSAVLKRALLKNPALADKELAKICKAEGHELSPFSIAARKADFLHTIKLLRTDNRLKD